MSVQPQGSSAGVGSCMLLFHHSQPGNFIVIALILLCSFLAKLLGCDYCFGMFLSWTEWTGLSYSSILTLLSVWNTNLSLSLTGHFVSNLRSNTGTLQERCEIADLDLDSLLLFCFMSPCLNEWVYRQSESANFICSPRLYLSFFFYYFWVKLLVHWGLEITAV